MFRNPRPSSKFELPGWTLAMSRSPSLPARRACPIHGYVSLSRTPLFMLIKQKHYACLIRTKDCFSCLRRKPLFRYTIKLRIVQEYNWQYIAYFLILGQARHSHVSQGVSFIYILVFAKNYAVEPGEIVNCCDYSSAVPCSTDTVVYY